MAFKNFNKLSIIVLILLFVSQSLTAQDCKTTIRGHEPSLKNQKIEFEIESDFISGLPKVLTTVTADDSGTFSVNLPIKEVTFLKLNFGKFSGVLFAEPCRNYDLQFPKFEHKDIVDSLNPYFEPVSFYFIIKNPIIPELNDAIANLDQIINEYLGYHFYHLTQQRYFSEIDTLAPFLDSLFSDIEHPFFLDYKRYSLAHIYTLIRLRNDQFLIKNYLMDQPILYNNPAYGLFFEQIFTNYIQPYSETKYGKRIIHDIARAKSYTFAMETLANNPVLRGNELRELVLIKSLYDVVIEDQLPKSSCMQTLDSVRILTNIDKHRDIVDNVIKKLNTLAVGTTIPDFELYDSDNNLVKSKHLKGKFIYLTFMNIKAFNSLNDLETLSALNQKYSDKLRIVTVIIGSGTMNEAKKIFSKNKYDWLLLDGTNNQQLEQDYKLRASLTCYLVSSDLKLLMSPALNPNEKFEVTFINFLRAERIEQLRNTKKNDSLINKY